MLTVLAYGRWCEYIEAAWGAELGDIQQLIGELRAQGAIATVGGPDLTEVKRAAEDIQAFLEHVLPLETPKDLGLVVSDALLDAVGEVVADRRRQLPELRLDVIRPILASMAARFIPIAGKPLTPVVQSHPELDYLLYTAALGGAEYLVTEERTLLKKTGEPWPISWPLAQGSDGTTTYSVSLSTFIERELSKWPFDLDNVPPELFVTAATGERIFGAEQA